MAVQRVLPRRSNPKIQGFVGLPQDLVLHDNAFGCVLLEQTAVCCWAFHSPRVRYATHVASSTHDAHG